MDIRLLNNDDAYFAYKALSASQIKAYDHSTYAFWKGSCFNPDKAEDKETDALIFGKLTHCLLLEPEEVENRFVVQDFGKTRRNKEYDKVKTLFPNKIIVSPAEMDKAQKMVAEIRKHKLANLIFDGGKCEVPFVWTDEETGLDCKMKADAIKKIAGGRVLIVDYKTSSDISSVLRWPEKLGYPLQEAFYRMGVAKKLNMPLEQIDFVFVLQSNIDGEEDVICVAGCDYDTQTTAADIVRHHINAISTRLTAWNETHDAEIFAAYPAKETMRYSNWYLQRGE